MMAVPTAVIAAVVAADFIVNADSPTVNLMAV